MDGHLGHISFFKVVIFGICLMDGQSQHLRICKPVRSGISLSEVQSLHCNFNNLLHRDNESDKFVNE